MRAESVHYIVQLLVFPLDPGLSTQACGKAGVIPRETRLCIGCALPGTPALTHNPADVTKNVFPKRRKNYSNGEISDNSAIRAACGILHCQYGRLDWLFSNVVRTAQVIYSAQIEMGK